MYPSLGAVQQQEPSEGGGGSGTYSVPSTYTPTPYYGPTTTAAQEAAKIGYSDAWAPDFTMPVLKVAPEEDPGTPPPAFVPYSGPPMVMCAPGWTGLDCKTRIEDVAAPTQPSGPFAPVAPPPQLPDGVTAYSGPMMTTHADQPDGGGVIEAEVYSVEDEAPGAFDFGKLLPLLLTVGFAFLKK